MSSVKRFTGTLVQEWQRDQVPRHAAAIAYYTVFTLPASMLLILLIAGRLIGQETVEGEVFAQMTVLMGADLTQFIQSILSNIHAERPSSWVNVIGIAFIILGATGVFRELRHSLNKILQSDAPKN